MSEVAAIVDQPWGAWAQVAVDGKWHQCDWDSRTGMAFVHCMGQAYAVPARRVMDYRWLPRLRCQRPLCGRPAEPGNGSSGSS